VKKRAAFFGEAEQIRRVYAGERWDRVAKLTDLRPGVVRASDIAAAASGGDLADVEVAFSTWGMPRLTDTHLNALPHLQAVFYAAGSVQAFARPVLERGIAVFSAWQSNAVPVAEFTLGQILLAGKGYFRNERDCQTYEGRQHRPHRGHGNYGETVALLGAGAIGRRVIDLLKPFRLHIIVFDPFLSEIDAAVLGVEKVSIEDAFSRGYIVSNHLANKQETVKMLNAPLFALLRDNATFINTGRGATVDEDALIAEFTRRPTLTALLDVTWPEPPAAESPLYTLPNVHLTSHIAGSIGDEVRRMADDMIAEFTRWERGEPTPTRVTLPMLDHMA
jgi:phosphoglycerate dehydrogenase-like enzyme